MSKSKSSRLSKILDETNPSKIDTCKSKNEALLSEVCDYASIITSAFQSVIEPECHFSGVYSLITKSSW